MEKDLPKVIYLVTNETDRTVESLFYNSSEAVKELHRLTELRPRQTFMVVEHEIN
mgnify:CR=1 FL=1